MDNDGALASQDNLPQSNSNGQSTINETLVNSDSCHVITAGLEPSLTESENDLAKNQELRCDDVIPGTDDIVQFEEKMAWQPQNEEDNPRENQNTKQLSHSEYRQNVFLIETELGSGEKNDIELMGCITSPEEVNLYSENYSTRQKPSQSQQQSPQYAQEQYVQQPRTQYYGQTPYYQQQVVGGQPVYSSAPPPQDARRAAQYRPGRREPEDIYQAQNLEGQFVFTTSFDNREVRRRFVQKVYMILTVMLTVTTGIIMLCIYEPHCKRYFYGNVALLFLFLFIYLILVIAITCYSQVRRSYPLNLILLGILTVAMSFFCGIVSVHYSTLTVLMAMGITALTSFVVSIFACQTRIDVTGWGIYLYVALIVLILFGIIAMIVAMTTGSGIMLVVYSGLGALLMCLFLVFDTQQVMGGKRFEISPEEYIVGALTLYMDIMLIFLYMIKIMGYARG